MSTYEFIAAHRPAYPVTVMCAVLGVGRLGFYAWVDREPSKRERDDAKLAVEIKAAHQASRRIYGAPRIHRELRDQHVRVGRKRIARLMRQHGLAGRCGRRKAPRTTTPAVTAPAIPDLVKRRFVASAR